MSGHIHGTVEKMLIPVSTVPVQERRWIKAATAQTIPVMKRDVTGKYLGQMTDVLHISHNTMRVWVSLLPHILLQPVMNMDVQVQERQAVLTAVNIPAQRNPVLEKQ